MGVAEAAVAAAGEGDGLARRVEVGEDCLAVVVEDERADGDGDEDVAGAGTGAVGAGAVAALGGAEVLGVAEVDESVKVFDGLEGDVATAAAIAAVRSAEL